MIRKELSATTPGFIHMYDKMDLDITHVFHRSANVV
jgi:hypothetical protein